MKTPKYLYGSKVKEPKIFNPNHSYVEKGFLVKVDLAARVAKKIPLHWDGGGSVYYQLLPQSQTATPSATPMPAVKAVKPKKPTLKIHFRVNRGLQKYAVFACIMMFLTGGYLLVAPLYPKVEYEVSIKPMANKPEAIAATTKTEVSAANQLVIPKIGVRTPILESDTLDILDREVGVWHQTGELNKGNFVLAGHRFKYLPPNASTFYNLDKLEVGDTIVVDWNKERIIYQVNQKMVVPKTRVDLIAPTDKPQITLYTCNEANEENRVVVIAEPLP